MNFQTSLLTLSLIFFAQSILLGKKISPSWLNSPPRHSPVSIIEKSLTQEENEIQASILLSQTCAEIIKDYPDAQNAARMIEQHLLVQLHSGYQKIKIPSEQKNPVKILPPVFSSGLFPQETPPLFKKEFSQRQSSYQRLAEALLALPNLQTSALVHLHQLKARQDTEIFDSLFTNLQQTIQKTSHKQLFRINSINDSPETTLIQLAFTLKKREQIRELIALDLDEENWSGKLIQTRLRTLEQCYDRANQREFIEGNAPALIESQLSPTDIFRAQNFLNLPLTVAINTLSSAMEQGYSLSLPYPKTRPPRSPISCFVF